MNTAVFPSFLRPMHADETSKVDTLLRIAFEGPSEAELVTKASRSWRDGR